MAEADSSTDKNVELQEKIWMYLDKDNNLKGPVPGKILLRLLEKNLGVSGETLAWKPGMEKWLSLAEIDLFKEVCAFHNMIWSYIDTDGSQRGPISSRLLLHKLKEGDVDGLTLVFNPSLEGWTKVSDVAVLKKEIQKIAFEEEIASQVVNSIPVSDQTFEFNMEDIDEGVQTKFPTSDPTPKPSGEDDSAKKNLQAFRADNGVRYIWDEIEQEWVEDPNQEESEDEEEGDDVEDDDENGAEEYKHMTANGGDNVEAGPSTQNKHNNRNGTANHVVSSGVGDGETSLQSEAPSRKKRKRKNKKAPVANHWVYVTGLPPDVTVDEVKEHFSKVGLIALNPIDQQPKIKLYYDDAGNIKGDCSICYNAIESVQMAVDVFDEGYLRPKYKLRVSLAEFQKDNSTSSSHTTSGSVNGPEGSSYNHHKRPRPAATKAQRKVAQSAIAQALTWNDEDDIGISKKQGLKIVVIEGMFVPEEFEDPDFSDELERDVADECEKYGEIDKMTVFSQNPRGIVVVKFKTAFAAQECIRGVHGRYFAKRVLKCYFWDGTTNYSIVSPNQEEEEEKKEKERIDEFGDWLEQEQQELPPELQLRSEA